MNMDLLKHHIELLIRKQAIVTDKIVYMTADEEDEYLSSSS